MQTYPSIIDKRRKEGKKNWTNNRIITILQTFATTYDRSHKFTTYLLVSSKGCLFHNARFVLFVRCSCDSSWYLSICTGDGCVRLRVYFCCRCARYTRCRWMCLANFYCIHLTFFGGKMTMLFNEMIWQISIRSSSRSLCSNETEYNNVNKDIMVLISLYGFSCQRTFSVGTFVAA